MTQSSDPIIQTKICPISGKEFVITQGDIDFYDKISPTFAGQKFQIPTPTLCPDERQRRRLAFRNERHLYRRICDASGKQIISMYKPDNGYKVYDQKIRRSDNRDAMDYGRDFDFSKTFTENFRLLTYEVPLPSMYNFGGENSDYCNCSSYQKNCYLTSAATYNEKSMYSAYINDCNYCLDGYMIFDCEQCYMAIDCEKSFKLLYASHCRNCSESYFLTNCNDCSFCWNCDGLQNQKYCIDNIAYEKEEYFSQLVILQERTMKQTFALWIQRKQRDTILFSENSTGSHIRYSKNSLSCVDVLNLEDCKYCTRFFDSKKCHDIYAWGQNAESCYEDVAIGENVYGLLFCSSTNANTSHMLYCFHCEGSSNCFGCIGLRNKSYYIFNKQYTKEEYENQVAKIITHMQSTGEWGEFFHPSLSPFGYNETVAQEYYPCASEDGKMMQKISEENQSQNSLPNLKTFGYQRSDYESPKPVSDKVIQGKDLPETIDEVHDDILQYAIACEVMGKLFRIQPQELAFYRKHHLPLPRKHPDQRHLERLQLRK